MEFSEAPCHGTVNSATASALRSSAGALQDALIQELAGELDAHRLDLAHYLGFSNDVGVLDILRVWCSNPGATVFVLHSVLSTIGRGDLAHKLLQKMQSMPLHVMVIEVEPGISSNPSNNPQGVRFQTVMTPCDTELSSALRGVLSSDLSYYQIVGPGPWVSWSTKACQLKGQQLTLQRRQNPSWKTEQSPYGCNSCQVGNSKSYTDKSKIDSSPRATPNMKRPTVNSRQHRDHHVWEDDETLVKRPNTLSSDFNIRLNDEIMDENAMIEIQKFPLGLSPSPTPISSESNLTPFNTSQMLLTPDTDDSLDVHCRSIPAGSPSITSVEDEFTIDENTGVKTPLYKQHSNSLNGASQFSTHAIPQLSQNSSYKGSNHLMTDNVSNINEIQDSYSIVYSAINTQGNFNNLNSSSQTKLKQLSGTVECDSYTNKEIIHKEDLFKNNSYDEKLVIDCGNRKSGNVEEMMEINSDSYSHSTSVLSPGGIMGASGSSNLMQSPKVLPFGGLSSSDYVPHHLVSGHCSRSTSDYANSSTESGESLDYNMNSITDNSQADNFDCAWNTKAQGLSYLKSNGNQVWKGQIDKHPSNPPMTNHVTEVHNNLSQNDIVTQPTISQHQSKMKQPQSRLPPKTNMSYIVHTPVSSSDYMGDLGPPSYLDVVESNEVIGTEHPFPPRNDFTAGQVDYAQVGKSQSQATGNPQPIQNNMNFPASNLSKAMRYTHQFSSSPDKTRKLLAPSVNPSRHLPPIPPFTHNHIKNNAVVSEDRSAYLTPCNPLCDTHHYPPTTTTISLPQPPLHQQKQPQQRNPQAQTNGSVVSDDGTCYNYIDNRIVASTSLPNNGTRGERAPKPPPRRMSRMSLDEQLAKVEGWCPDEKDKTIEETMEPYRCQDGYYIVWKSKEKNRYIITVSHRRVLNHFLIEEEREGNSDQIIYFIYKHGGYRSESLLDLVNHYIQSGIKQPLVDERLGLKAYACIHIPLKCPLKVEFVSKRKSHAK